MIPIWKLFFQPLADLLVGITDFFTRIRNERKRRRAKDGDTKEDKEAGSGGE